MLRDDDRRGNEGKFRWRLVWQWFVPGLGVKRWLLLAILGVALLGLGIATFALDYYRAHPDSKFLATISLQNLELWQRALIFGVGGAVMLLGAIFRLNRAILAPYLRPGKSVVDAVARYRRRGRGPKVVAIGGGTGLSAFLRGFKHLSSNLTAVVSVADDGGSSGRLRTALGLPPPGDLRSCLAALSDDEELLTQLFQYRFLGGEELEGHSFGNLFIAALARVSGSFEKGIDEAGRVLGIRGRVMPSSLVDLSLVAEKVLTSEAIAVRVEGESRIPESAGRVVCVQLEPPDPPAYPGALNAILNADMICIGPGSLYTSVIPNLLVPDIRKAIQASRALKVYVCNLATQKGETDGFSALDHLAALESHGGYGLVDIFLVNNHEMQGLPEGTSWIAPPESGVVGVAVHQADLADANRPGRHDSTKLARVLMDILEERTGPLELSMDEIREINGRWSRTSPHPENTAQNGRQK